MATKQTQFGFSLVEAMLAIALFAIFATAFVSATLQGQQSTVDAGDRTRAENLVEEALEAVRSIDDDAWNEIIYAQSAVEESGTQWDFTGEGTDETIDIYTRTIEFENVCRDGTDAIAACPATYTDPHTKRVDVTVEWEGIYTSKSVTGTAYITNWSADTWEQTDWSGGSGQNEWSDDTQFESDDGNIDFATAGQIELTESGACTGEIYNFDTASNYTVSNSSDIEVTGGNAQLISAGSVIDDITNSVTDSLEFDTSYGNVPTVTHVSGDIYAIAYTGSGNDGWLKTVDIDSSGTVGAAVIDTYEFDTSNGLYPVIEHVSGDIFAIAYSGPGNDGWLKTVEIDSAGSITSSVVDSLEFDTSYGVWPDIQAISGDIFSITYQGPGSDGWIKTVEIDSAGSITSSVVDSLEYDTSEGRTPSVLPISGDIYAIAYWGNGSDGWLKTVEIDSAGSITGTVVDSFEFDTSYGVYPDLVAVSGDIYAIAYRGPGNDGWLKTVEIDSAGTITSSAVDSFEFNTSNGLEPEIFAASGDTFGIVYRGNGSDGFVTIIEIATDGTIASSATDTYEYDTSYAAFPQPVQLSTLDYAIIYRGPSNDGWIKTINFTEAETYVTTGPTVEPNASYSPATIDQWAGFVETATKAGSAEVYYQLSDDDGTTWYYWDSSAWTAAGSTDYNVASDIDTNIGTFNTSGGVLFKAFLVSNGSDQVQLDSVEIKCAIFNTWDFNTSSNYTLSNSSEIEVASGVAQLLSGSNIYTDITNPVLDSYNFNASNGYEPAVVNVAGDIYAIAYSGAGTDGWIATVEVDTSGNITSSVIDTLEYDTSVSRYQSLTHVSGDIFAVAYRGPGNDGYVKTIEIDSSGNITSSVVDTLEYNPSNGPYPHIVMVDTDTAVIAHTGASSDGWVETIDIDSAGTITSVDTLEFDTSYGADPYIVNVTGDIFAVAYSGPGTDGWLKTLDIDSSGNIASSVVDSLEFDTSYAFNANMYALDSDTVAIAYRGPGNDGWLKTVDIDSSGTISSVTDSLEYNTSYALEPSIELIEGDFYTIAYRGSGSDGFVALVEMDSSGTIASTVTDSLEFDTSYGVTPIAFAIDTGIHGIVYRGTGGNWLKTIEITADNYPTNGPTVEPNSVFSAGTIDAWTAFTETATKGGTGEVYYQLSEDGTNWYYWDSSAWSAAGAADYNIAADVDTNIEAFSTTSGDIMFKAFLVSDGSNQVQLDSVAIGYQGGGGSGSYETSAYLISSAFDMGTTGSIEAIEWTESVPSGTDVQLQVRATTDSSGSPDAASWTDWYGTTGATDYYTDASGELISSDLNGNQWIQYRIELTGDGSDTPTVEDVSIRHE